VREFVAVDAAPDEPRSARPAASHLTLRFLGDVAPERNAALAVALEGVARASRPFVLRLEGVGAFPTADRPRVVWIGVTTGRTEIVELARAVRGALAPLLGDADEAFVPHLTLFRVRSPTERQAARELLEGARPAPPPWDVRVEEMLLKESRLGAAGAVHRTLAAFRLGDLGGARA
jgi:RNA 2',3'-cyclic 3'-phosphodiesterase